MHMMLHGVMEVPRVPLSNAACRQVAIYPTPQQVRRVQRELRSFVFFYHPTPALASWRHPLWCSGLGLRAGLTKEEQCTGGWMDGWKEGWKQPKLKQVASVFFWLTLQCNSRIHLFLPDWILLLDWASKRVNVTICRNVSCPNSVENHSVSPGFLFLKGNGSSNHVRSYDGFELLKTEHGNCGQSIMPRASDL